MADLAMELEQFHPGIDGLVSRTLASSQYILGPRVAEFEDLVSLRFGSQNMMSGVNSGTDALVIGLLAAGVQAGDEILTTPFTFVATAEAIIRIGARPVFADIDPHTLNLSRDTVQASLTERTKAVIFVHLFGNPSGILEVAQLCRERGIHLIEDVAQAFGAAAGDSLAGTIGVAAAFSFFPTKILGAAGDAGAVLTSPDRSMIVRALRNHGSLDRISYPAIGFNSRLDEIQACILLAKLPTVDRKIAARQAIARDYTRALGSTPAEAQSVHRECTHVYNYFTIRVPGRDGLRDYLATRGIESAIYYRHPLHLLEAFGHLGYASGDFPQAEFASASVLSLPCHPVMTQRSVEAVAESIQDFFS